MNVWYQKTQCHKTGKLEIQLSASIGKINPCRDLRGKGRNSDYEMYQPKNGWDFYI